MITVHRAAGRHHWSNEWLDSWQSFPATGNYDLAGNAHGVLMVNNDDTIDPGEGLDRHRHSEVEILTWVLSGAVEHRDSKGHNGILRPGQIQRMTAGTGITHSERNAMTRSSRAPARVVQMWVAPDTAGLAPSYAEADLTGQLDNGGLVLAASGRPGHDAAVSLANRFAALHVARLDAGGRCMLPAAPYGHLYLPTGEVSLPDAGSRAGGTVLHAGDAVRTRDAPAIEVIAGAPSELLYWEMHAAFDTAGG
ncbi:hypothetical protein GOARA_021_00150 [Gordonia araii NBRC 100433]|uniref:Pirin N-terminal domain-containing protein n=1 Tax=Gordonia araii NBRC 100433 TaxID=1073574 RepID=G7GYV3_9ACTN|nr:pirin family protein [Gordonia araii]NNG96988.1 pirin family protein [Gordonia araii NBRC 100433]GAB08778.1 hypothetical protein GOARA_021_00150 [Gordonia araii NBRC 100433]